MNKAPRVRNQECQEPSGMSGMGWTTDPTCWAFPDNPDSRVSHRVEFSFFSISQVSSVLARVNQDCQDSEIPRHAPTCGYWLDQYPWECTCGLTAPLPTWGGDKS